MTNITNLDEETTRAFNDLNARPSTNNISALVKKELEGGEDKDLNEERLVGPSDEGDDDPADTTPAEASEQADEGGKILEEERKRKQNPDEL